MNEKARLNDPILEYTITVFQKNSILKNFKFFLNFILHKAVNVLRAFFKMQKRHCLARNVVVDHLKYRLQTNKGIKTREI